MTPAERDRVLAALRSALDHLLDSGEQGTTVEVPELGEVWTISREPS